MWPLSTTTLSRVAARLEVLPKFFLVFYTPLTGSLCLTDDMANPSAADKKHYVDASVAQTFVETVLTANGVASTNASIVARCLIAADLRGVDTHGMNRIPSYMERIRQGVLDASAAPELRQITPAVAQIDARNGFGFVAADLGMAAAIESAKIYGIGMASIKNSNHFGMAAWIVQKALDSNMMSLVFTNSSPALPAWGGKVSYDCTECG
jgi:LDH2 family malate/lactate/ureidoglycolate dehydrogenase